MSDSLGATSVVDWVRQTVERQANSVAATGVGETLTFDELWSRVTRLARELVGRGVEPEDRVGIWAEQSSDLIVGMLGIMAAGAAYVPLDPSYPKGRLERIVADAGVGFIVSPHRHQAQAAEAGLPVVPTTFLDAGASAGTALPHVTDNSAAYVLYTSGSTGRPKGVVIEHGAVMHLLRWMIADCGMVAGDRVMGTASPAYDASVPTFLLPLVTGGTFIALAAETTVDPFALADAIVQYRPRALQASPTMLRMLTESRWVGDPTLEVWTGGEQTAASAIRYIAPRVRVLCNYYGPTEATVQITVARLGPDDGDAPVGRPANGVGCVILDADGQQVANGNTGELYITGPTLAREYLNEPELTAERFVQLSLLGQDPVRAYRTSDLARFRADGSLVILGRVDDQIKVRGYLIEPREIEVRLMDFQGVQDAVVLAHEASDDDEPTLVAYVKSAEELSVRDVRAFVKEALPDHMVPTSLVRVESFPLTANGKVDRRQLAKLGLVGATAASPALARSMDTPGGVDEEVRQLFASVLSVRQETISLDDDFFDVGGTSLRCARLFMAIEDRYGVALPLSTLARAPTARLLAATIVQEREGRRAGRSHTDPPRHEWERILGNLWTEILGIHDVRRTDSFFALGGSDEDAIRMLEQLKAIDGVDVTPQELRRAPTIVELASVIGSRSARSSLVPLQTTGSGTPFFCIAGAGGLAVTFMPLAKLLGPDQPFYGLQAQGIERRAVPDYTLGRAARRYAKEIRAVQPRGPYLIGGHSLGGAIALKVVHLLEAEGERVALFAVFDSVLTEPMVGAAFPGHAVGQRSSGRWSVLPRHPKPSTIVRLPLAGIVPFHGIGQFEVFAGLGQLQAAFARRLQPWGGTAIVFVSDDEESENVEFGWGCLLTGKWTSVSVPGEHITMLEKSNIAVAAMHLRDLIAATSLSEKA